MKILISDKAHESCAQKFQEAGFEVDENVGLSADELKKIIKDYDGLVIRSATQVTEELLEAAGNLKVVARAGTGLDNVDIDAATKKNVVVMNTPGQNSNAAAELAIGMMFSLARHLPRACSSLKACKWEKKSFQGSELMGKTLGVVGFGNIGRIVGEIGRGIRMNVLAYDPIFTEGQIRERGGDPVSFDELIDRSDFVTIHIPKTPETTGLFNAEIIGRMKQGSFLINCARGGIVDENALYDALASKHLGGGALDVFEVEPPEDVKLLELENFVCTPHIGASTIEAQINVAVAAAEQIVKFLNEGVAINAVNA